MSVLTVSVVRSKVTQNKQDQVVSGQSEAQDSPICLASEHLMDRLVLAGCVSAIERDAAMRFLADYQAAGLTPHLAASYSPVRGSFSFYGGWDERSDAQEEAYARYRKAMRFLQGSLGDTVVSVICYETVPNARKIAELKVGLKVLVSLYR